MFLDEPAPPRLWRAGHPSPAQGPRAAHRTRATWVLRAVPGRAADRRGLGAQRGLPPGLVLPRRDRAEAERRLERFLAAVDRSQLPAFAAFAEGVRLWSAELLAYFDEQTTNGYAEGVIIKVKVIKHCAYGLPRFTGFASACA
jgi:hypothetical protein